MACSHGILMAAANFMGTAERYAYALHAGHVHHIIGCKIRIQCPVMHAY
jgi:hypothetical protein